MSNRYTLKDFSPSLDEIQETVFDFGIYSGLTAGGTFPMTAKNMRFWMERNLTEGSPEDIKDVVYNLGKAFAPVEDNDAFKWVVSAKSPLFPEGNDPSKNFMSYLVLLGNLRYNNEIGNATKDFDEMFHYADALMSPDNAGVVGSSVSYPLLTALIFKKDPEIARMFSPRLKSVFPHLVFDLDKWKSAMDFGAEKIAAMPVPSPADFVNAVAARFEELGGGEKRIAIASLTRCITELGRLSPEVDDFKNACKAAASLSTVACAYSSQDCKLLMDTARDIRMGISAEAQDVDFNLDKIDVVDPYDQYEKEFGPINDSPSKSPFRARVGEMLNKLVGNLDKDAGAHNMQEAVSKLAITAVEHNMDPNSVVEKLKANKAKISPQDVQDFLRENTRDKTKHLNDDPPEIV